MSLRSASSRFRGRKENNKVPTTTILNNNNNEKQKTKEEEEEEDQRKSSKDLILPVGFEMSDLVSRSSGDESIMSEEDYSGLV